VTEPRIKDEESGKTFESVHEYWLYWCEKDGIEGADRRYKGLMDRMVKSIEAAVDQLTNQGGSMGPKLEYVKLGDCPQKEPIPLRRGERRLVEGIVRPTARKVRRLMYHQHKPWKEFEKCGIVTMLHGLRGKKSYREFWDWLCISMGGVSAGRWSPRRRVCKRK